MGKRGEYFGVRCRAFQPQSDRLINATLLTRVRDETAARVALWDHEANKTSLQAVA